MSFAASRLYSRCCAAGRRLVLAAEPARRGQTGAVEDTARHGRRRVAAGSGGRQGDPAQGRQRGRCGRGDGVRHGGHLSGGRQHRRRRLHGRPSRAGQGEPVVIDYRETAPGRRDEDDVHQKRYACIRIAPSACRARCAAWRWRTRASASCRGKTSSLPAVKLAEEGFVLDDYTGRFAQLSSSAAPATFPNCVRVFGKNGKARLEGRRPAGAERPGARR